MLIWGTQPTAASLKLRADSVVNWVDKWQEIDANGFFSEITANNLVIYSTLDNEWLAKVTWSGDRIVIAERGECSLHRFYSIEPALIFLDALVLHYIARATPTAHFAHSQYA